MSLLEVLISIFVIMFGLLGVAAILPLGGRNVAEVVKSDNSSACGAAALHDIRAWGMDVPVQPAIDQPSTTDVPVWVSYDPDFGFTTAPTAYTSMKNASKGQVCSFILDPSGVARYGATATQPRKFPFNATYGLLANNVSIQMSRATLRVSPPFSTYTYVPMPLTAADRIFRWHDDVTIPLPTEGTERPKQMVLCVNSSNFAQSAEALPIIGSLAGTGIGGLQANVNPIEHQSDGDYSWLAMITPAPGELSLTSRAQHNFTVSVVVFRSREFDLDAVPPLERTVRATLLGGGDVKLTVPVASDPELLRVRKGQWILLCGIDSTAFDMGYNDTLNTNVTQTGIMMYRWYRVVAVGDAVPDPMTGTQERWARYVTLSGSDWVSPSWDTTSSSWNNHWCDRTAISDRTPVDTDGDGTAADVVAVLVDGVIGVYTTSTQVPE